MRLLGIGLAMGFLTSACSGLMIDERSALCQQYPTTIDNIATLGDNDQLSRDEILTINLHRLRWREACIDGEPVEAVRMHALPLIAIEKGKQAWLSQQPQ